MASEQTSSEILDRAWQAKLDGEPDKAIDLFAKVIEADPLNAEAHRELALIYYGFKKNSLEAARLLQISLSLQETADAHYFLALVMEHLGCPLEAQSEFFAAFNCYREHPNDSLYSLARLHYAQFLARQGQDFVQSKSKLDPT